MLTEHEVSNKGGMAYHRSAGFYDWLFNQELLDLGFIGSKFTWIRGASSITFKGARLDRGVYTIDWRELFPEAKVTHLPIIKSDHAPFLVELYGNKNVKTKSSFCFQAAWMTHSDFQKVIQHEWLYQQTLNINVSKVANSLSKWNYSTFGNIHRRKKKLIARIEGVQRCLNYQPRNRLIKLESKLRKELDKVLEQEELLWF